MLQKASPSLCVISPNAYGFVSGQKTGHIGGVEWQTTLTAKWFAAHGYKVSMLTWDEGGPPEETFHGIRVIKICRKDAGLKGLRFFHPKWTGLTRALRLADASLYYQNGCECTTGQVAMWCRRNGRKFIFSSANDPDVCPDLPDLKTALERAFYRYGLRNADAVILQTQTQREFLRKHFALGSTVIPMPCPGCPPDQYVPRTGIFSKKLLWAARVTQQKRPDLLLDLAAALPGMTFEFVGPFSGGNSPLDEYAAGIKKRASEMPNVIVRGAVPREKLAEYYKSAGCFCSTSDYEGFPNTFLEAWSYGLPLVSTFDPDGVISKWGLGLVVKNMPEMQEAINSLFASPEAYVEMSRNARQYYLNHHTVESTLPRFESVFRETVDRG